MQEQLNNLERSLGRVEGKIDGILNHLEKMNGRLGKHGNRIDALDIQMTEIKTKASLLGAGAGAVIIVAWEFVKNKIFK